MLNSIALSIIAKFVNADTIGGYVRAAVAAGASALLAWTGSWILPFISAEAQTAVTAAITALLVGLWSQIAKQTTAPTTTQIDKVANEMVKADVLTPKEAEDAKAKIDESIK